MSSTTPPPTDPGGPEYLDMSDGEPLGPSTDGGSGGRRTTLIAGGAIAGLLAVGGGVWAAMSFFASGPQPAEILPAATVGYASIDLDPSGGQKIEAFRMIEKFPAIKKELNGFDADDDLLAKMFSQLENECEGLNYAEDVKPWLGYRFAVAAVDLGEDLPTPVGVVQVTDAGAAEEGLTKLRDCGARDEQLGGWVIDGEWAVVAETEALAQQVVDATDKGTLAQDEDYQEWTDKVGEQGVVTMYASPAVGRLLSETMSQDLGMMGGEELTDDMSQAWEDFGGAAATVRFADGGMEFAYAAGMPRDGLMAVPMAEDATLDVVNDLPDDTAMAFGVVFPDGWAQTMLDSMTRMGMSEDEIETGLSQFEAETGLSLPDDVETLLGEQLAVSFSSGFDVEKLANASDPSEVPLGVTVQGDPAAIEDVMRKLGEALGMPEMFEVETSDDRAYWSLSDDYRAALVDGGALGDSDAYQGVVPEADRAASVMFVNFDAGDWLTSLAESDQELADNLAPLDAFGVSSWTEDETLFGEVRLTTD